MDELKTIQDIRNQASMNSVSREDLRASAIEDIKRYKENMKQLPSLNKDMTWSAVIDYIIWKFNITLEELKEASQ